MELLPTPIRTVISNTADRAEIKADARYIYFLLADIYIEEQRTAIPERIDLISEEKHISINSIVAVTPKNTSITLHRIGGSFPPRFRRNFSFLQQYDREELTTLNLGNTYPPAGYYRLHDPYHIMLDNIRTLSGKYLPYLGRGIFQDNNYWSLGLFGNWKAENLRTGEVVEKKKRIAHYHYEFRNEERQEWLIFVDVGRYDMPVADILQNRNVPSVCREVIRELGMKYLLPQRKNRIQEDLLVYLEGRQ